MHKTEMPSSFVARSRFFRKTVLCDGIVGDSCTFNFMLKISCCNSDKAGISICIEIAYLA
ncbi:hypothetical protein PUN28_018818 [Cardiocondyla obscurior]|uniref:Uncharacterized protein n=1 Tax=Cardiocondyla obscurior TaxID=286306 RepID=A0AAW2EG57_9HYME